MRTIKSLAALRRRSGFAAPLRIKCLGLAAFCLVLSLLGAKLPHQRALGQVPSAGTTLRNTFHRSNERLWAELVELWQVRVRKRSEDIVRDAVREFGTDNTLGRVWDYFYPDWHCPFAERLGKQGDGGKWICNINSLQSSGCVVYSLGLFDNDEFERAVHAVAPGCEIHSFDPTPSEISKFHMDEKLAAYGAHFHHFGVTGTGEDINIEDTLVPTKTLKDVMLELGHKTLTILKIDIEFSEYGVFDELFCKRNSTKCHEQTTIQNLLVELHFREAQEVVSLFERFAEHGFGIFSYEPNPIGYPLASEFALVKVKNM